MADRKRPRKAAFLADDPEDEDADEAQTETVEKAVRPARALPPDEREGTALIVASWVGTVAYGVTAVVATVSSVQAPMVAVSCVLFVIGLVAFMAAYLLAIGRSREDAIGMGGLFFLAGTAPRRVQVHLLGSTAVEVVLATVTASIGIATIEGDASNPLAFGFLVPLYGLGLAGLWGARHGTFAPRAPDSAPG